MPPAPGPVDADTQAVLSARSPAVVRFMTFYMRRYARRHFHAVRLAHGSAPAVGADEPVLVFANHPAWWDPVLFILLQAHCFAGHVGYGPMEAAALGRYGIFRRIGVFPIEPATQRGAARFLRIGSGLLGVPGTVLWVTAQGAFVDARRRPPMLRAGVAHLLQRHPRAVAVPLALEYPFWNESAPEALARFGPPLRAGAAPSVDDWQARLTAALDETMDRLAQDAMARDPGRFETVVAGRVGIGGIYDLFRSGRAALRGERARLGHGPAQ